MGGGVMLIIGFLLPSFRFGYPWGLNIAFVATGFMMIGKCAFELIKRVHLINSVWLMALTCLLGVTTLGACFNIPSSGYINMANAVYGNPILFLLFALIGTSFVIALAMLFERLNLGVVNKWILFVGQNSLTIMLLHKPIISIWDKVLSLTMLPDCICLFVVTLLTSAVCSAGCIVLNVCVPQIIGRE